MKYFRMLVPRPEGAAPPISQRRLSVPRARFLVLVPALAMMVGAAVGCSAAEAGGVGGFGGFGGAGGEGGSGGEGGAAAVMPLLASAIAVGAGHSCAILTGGGVACWGDGARGQLGDGVSGKGHQRALPNVVPGLSGVTVLRAGGDTTCAIDAGGVKCWGDGAFGQLGDGMASDGYLSAKPVAVVGLEGAVDVSISGSNVCAVRSDGSVYCWGRNAAGGWLGFDSSDCGPYAVATGDGDPALMTIPCEPAPKKVDGAKGAVAVATGGVHNCALAKEGWVMCWGADHFGQLGDGDSGPDAGHSKPIEVYGLKDARRIALGASHTCVIAGDAGGVRCWGDNAYGQLGIGTDALDSYKIKPTDVAMLDSVVDLHAENRTTCAALADGSVVCWGDTATVLPVSPEKSGNALVPTQVPGVAAAVEVRTGGSHVCARLADDTVTCWGLDDRGQLGSGLVGVADFSMLPVVSPLDSPG
ncbi:BNR repeat domain protein [Minicystis rosea]|nr:BNR repeat domain protein [Minicystis rosea]